MSNKPKLLIRGRRKKNPIKRIFFGKSSIGYTQKSKYYIILLLILIGLMIYNLLDIILNLPFFNINKQMSDGLLLYERGYLSESIEMDLFQSDTILKNNF